jgi:hypothetical protein
MYPEFTLIDDGTLDTVCQCDRCGEVLRFSGATRDELGYVDPEWLADQAEHHADSGDCAD